MPELILPQAPDLIGMKRNALANVELEQHLKAAPGEQAYVQKKRGWEEEDRKSTLQQHKFKDEEDLTGFIVKELPMMNYQNWNESRQYLIDLGMNKSKLLSKEQITQDALSKNINPEQHFESYKQALGTTAAQRFEALKQQQAQNFELKKAAIGKMPEMGKTREVQKGTTSITQEWDGEKWVNLGSGPKWAPKDEYSETTEIDPKTGQVKITKRAGKGAGDTSGLTKGAVGKIQEDLIGVGDQLMALDRITKTYEPKFLTLAPRFDAWKTNIKEKLGFTTSEEEKKQLSEFGAFRTNTIGNINRTLKRLAGTAVNQNEMERIMVELPNAGTGFLDKNADGPTMFMSKLKTTIQALKLAQAKGRYILKNGLSKEDIDYTDMPGIMKQRANEIYQQFTSQGFPPEQAKAKTASQIQTEFGI